MACLAAERHVDGDEVAAGQQLVQRFATSDADHLHTERVRPPGHRGSDPAHSDDAETLALQRGAEEVKRLPDAAAGASHFVMALDQPARGGQNQRHRQIRRRLGQHTRCVRDRYTELARRLDVDIVVADRTVGDHPKVRIRSQHSARQRIAEQRDRGIRFGQQRDDIVLASFDLRRMLDDIELAGQNPPRDRGVRSSEDDCVFHG